MTLAEALSSVRYITNADGQKTGAILPVQVLSELLILLKDRTQQAENREDVQLIQAWLQARTEDRIDTVSIAELEIEYHPQIEDRNDRSLTDNSGFGDALQQFRQQENIAAADIDPDQIFGNIRDLSSGREVVL